MNVFGKTLSKREFLERFAHPSQFAGAIPCILDYGKATGLKAVRVYTGAGLDFTILPTRGMDIAWATFNGKSLGFLSKTGPVHPRYYESKGLEWLRTFFGGLLTTCGLTYMGAPCIDEGEELGLHGRITNIEAEDISIEQEWQDDEYIISVKGKVAEVKFFGVNLQLTRKITVIAGQNIIKIDDTIENLGFKEEPLMVLYHFNFGYPLLSETAKLYASGNKVIPRDEEAKSNRGVEEYNVFQPPTKDYKEKVFFLDLKADKNGMTKIVLINEAMGIGIYEKFNKNQLPKFTEWKMMGQSEYVLGLEPGTAVPNGRKWVREQGELMLIQPGEVKTFSIELGVLENKAQFEETIDSIMNI